MIDAAEMVAGVLDVLDAAYENQVIIPFRPKGA
jgi:hypothetical protein